MVDAAPLTRSEEVAPAEPAPAGGGTPLGRVVALVLAFAFLAGAVGYAIGSREGAADPLSAVDVGFMQDMGYHHDQAVRMSIVLLGKDDLDVSLQQFALEIVVAQRTEMGIFNATLDRFGHESSPGETAMAWMDGPGVPLDEMDGLATDAQMEALAEAEGDEAAALWIAMITEHHLGGLHMADHEARHGRDETTVNLARSMVRTQRDEVLDIQRYRERVGLPIPEGFDEAPLEDQRLNPISLREQLDG